MTNGDSQRFEALKIRFQDQTELLYRLTLVDLRVFTGFITLQLAFGAWMAKNPIEVSNIWVKSGLLLIDLALSVVATALLHNNYMRRKEVVGTVKNCNLALGYEEKGRFLENKTLNAHTEFRHWAGWYFLGIWVAVFGVVMVLFLGKL